MYTVDFLKNLKFFKLCSKDLNYPLVEKTSDNCDKCKGFPFLSFKVRYKVQVRAVYHNFPVHDNVEFFQNL